MIKRSMNEQELFPLVRAVQNGLAVRPKAVVWRPSVQEWDDPSPWVSIPQGGCPRTWLHLADFEKWRSARLELAAAWPTLRKPPTKEILFQLVRAGELGLLEKASARWPLHFSLDWCDHAFASVLDASRFDERRLPLPLALGLGRWVVERGEANPNLPNRDKLSVMPSFLMAFSPNPDEPRDAELLAWWKLARALGESPNGVIYHSGQVSLLFRAVQKEYWAFAKQLVLDGADPNCTAPQRGHALLTAIDKERAGTLTALEEMRDLTFCMLDNGLDWNMKNPFPGQPSFEAFLPANSVLRHADQQWRALRRSETMDATLPVPQRAALKPRF